MRQRTKARTLSLGTISEGTLRPEDLIPAYVSALSAIRLSRDDRAKVRKLAREADEAFATIEASDDRHGSDVLQADETVCEVLQDLQIIADNYVPEYTYCGTLDGDGACFGVWPDPEVLEPFTHQGGPDGFVFSGERRDVPRVSPGTPLYFTHCLEVNDHGNATMYRRAGRGRWIEVWSVV